MSAPGTPRGANNHPPRRRRHSDHREAIRKGPGPEVRWVQELAELADAAIGRTLLTPAFLPILRELPNGLPIGRDRLRVLDTIRKAPAEAARSAVRLDAWLQEQGLSEELLEALRDAADGVPANEAAFRDVVARVTELSKRVARYREAQEAARLLAGAYDDPEALAQVREAVKRLETEETHEPEPERPIIVVSGRYMREITADTLTALVKANDPPTLFLMGGVIVRVKDGPVAMAEPLSVAALKGVMDRVADYVRESGDGFMPARPPEDVARDILALPARDIPLPELRGIRHAPVWLPDGRLLSVDGYDAESGLLLRLRGLHNLRNDMPLDEAKRLLLDELLVDFPFADEASKAHAVALILQPFIREMIDGPTPLFLIDAPARGTGKGLLADVCVIVPRGATAEVMSLTADEDETEKRITASLLAGHSHILLDNVTALRSNHLAAVLTARVWAGRRLGKSEIVLLPNTATWIATGNNVELSDELARRVVPIRLDAKVERPEERTGFKHRLPGWAYEHRSELVSACLSIIRSWVDAGRPEGDAVLGRFESWAAIMSGILDHIGLPGFLANRRELMSQADKETREWTAVCALWWENYQDNPITANDLFELVKERKLLLDVWGGRTPLGAVQRIGHALARRRDRIYGKYAIRPAGPDGVTRNASYRLELVTGGQRETPQNTPKTPAKHPTTLNGAKPRGNGVSQSGAGVLGVSGVFGPPPPADGEVRDSGPLWRPRLGESEPSAWKDGRCVRCDGTRWRWAASSGRWHCVNCQPLAEVAAADAWQTLEGDAP